MIPVAQFAWVVAAAVFGAGVAYATMRSQIAREPEVRAAEDLAIRKDLNGIGAKMRADEGRAERRWKQTVAALNDIAKTQADKQKISQLLREDAWRD